MGGRVFQRKKWVKHQTHLDGESHLSPHGVNLAPKKLQTELFCFAYFLEELQTHDFRAKV